MRARRSQRCPAATSGSDCSSSCTRCRTSRRQWRARRGEAWQSTKAASSSPGGQTRAEPPLAARALRGAASWLAPVRRPEIGRVLFFSYYIRRIKGRTANVPRLPPPPPSFPQVFWKPRISNIVHNARLRSLSPSGCGERFAAGGAAAGAAPQALWQQTSRSERCLGGAEHASSRQQGERMDTGSSLPTAAAHLHGGRAHGGGPIHSSRRAALRLRQRHQKRAPLPPSAEPSPRLCALHGGPDSAEPWVDPPLWKLWCTLESSDQLSSTAARRPAHSPPLARGDSRPGRALPSPSLLPSPFTLAPLIFFRSSSLPRRTVRMLASTTPT